MQAVLSHTNQSFLGELTPSNHANNRCSTYFYGFNGKERDDEGMGGGGATYDYGFRIYNPQIARFLSVDPLTASYPWYTPYQFAGNKPIWCIDLDGLEEAYVSEYYDPLHNNVLVRRYELTDKDVGENTIQYQKFNEEKGTFSVLGDILQGDDRDRYMINRLRNAGDDVSAIKMEIAEKTDMPERTVTIHQRQTTLITLPSVVFNRNEATISEQNSGEYTADIEQLYEEFGDCTIIITPNGAFEDGVGLNDNYGGSDETVGGLLMERAEVVKGLMVEAGFDADNIIIGNANPNAGTTEMGVTPVPQFGGEH
jgi:RHS repeat-associated protein